MRVEFFIARRYLTRGRQNTFLSIMSLVSMTGIGIGVAALVIALSLINGFQGDIRGKILASTAHILVNDRLGEGIAGYPRLIRQLEGAGPEVRSVTPVVFGTVLLRGTGRDVSGAIFRGMDLTRLVGSPWLARLEEGRLPAGEAEMVVGRDLAQKLGLFPGTTCLVVAPQPVVTPNGVIPKFRRYLVTGIFRSGLFEFDNATVVTNLAAGQRMFRLADRVSYLQIHLGDVFAAEKVGRRLREILPPSLAVITWKELNASLYSALDLEKTVLFFTLTLIIVVAALNIVAGLILLVMQKTKDIGILLSCGATHAMIRRIFVIQGAVIGAGGSLAGALLGLTFCTLANRFEWIRVPPDIYQVSHVPFRTTPLDLLAVMGVALLISLAATLIPASRAAKVHVVEAVKYE